MKLNYSSDVGSTIVPISVEVKEQLTWWSYFLRLCFQTKESRMQIPSGYDRPPLWAKQGDSDAAGGSLTSVGHGLGIVVGSQWGYIPWPKLFNSSAVAPCCNMKWRHKLSFLELNGHMARVCGFPDDVRDSIVVTNIDNSGSCRMAEKGYNLKCETTDTLLRATYEVATALNARAYVKKVTRLSTRAAIAVDAISKADFATFREVWPEHDLEPVKMPRVYLHWLQSPVKDNELGKKIIQELRDNGVPMLY